MEIIKRINYEQKEIKKDWHGGKCYCGLHYDVGCSKVLVTSELLLLVDEDMKYSNSSVPTFG